MKLSPQEKADRKAAFRRMTVAGKLEYIFAYYKLPLVLILIAAIAVGTVISHAIRRKNELLYLGFLNVSVGDELLERLTEGFVGVLGEDPKKNEVYAYTGLYISDNPAEENHEYSYASRLKMLAAMNAEQVDVVLLNREAYDLFSHSGYLLDLGDLLQREAPELLPDAAAYLTDNDVVLEDNAIEMELGTADSYQAMTESAANALEVTEAPIFRGAGFPEPVYLGVIANSPRLSAAVAYIQYVLFPGPPPDSTASP